MSEPINRGDSARGHRAAWLLGLGAFALAGAACLLAGAPPAVSAPDDKPPKKVDRPAKKTVLGFGHRLKGDRAKRIEERGGSEASEAAVAEGLKWLALHQARDGHWGLHDFNKHARTAPLPGGRIVPDRSTAGTARKNDTAGTAFGLLPFLAAGITHKAPAGKRVGPDYHKTVNAGLRWLMAVQSRAGASRGSYSSDMYAHALATIAVCEAYGMTRDPALRNSAQAGINYIQFAQDPVGGGWRYAPRMSGDLSMTGWHFVALKSAQMAGLKVPPVTLRKVALFLDKAETAPNSGGYSYVPNTGETASMTAAGLLCRQYLGANPRNKGLQAGLKKLRANPPSRRDGALYYEYYATQVMYHAGGDDWQFWNLGPKGDGPGGLRDALLARQDRGGLVPANKGSWPGGDQIGGRMGATSLSLLTLEIYYRHEPLYGGEAVEKE
jgi:hypothetical protein